MVEILRLRFPEDIHYFDKLKISEFGYGAVMENDVLITNIILERGTQCISNSALIALISVKLQNKIPLPK